MGDVVTMNPEIKEGEQCFPACKCGETYVPLAIMGKRPFIAALVCSECHTESAVVNGYITLE